MKYAFSLQPATNPRIIKNASTNNEKPNHRAVCDGVRLQIKFSSLNSTVSGRCIWVAPARSNAVRYKTRNNR